MDELDKQIVNIFWDADQNKSGSISMKELFQVLRSSGYDMTFEQFQENFSSFDQDGDDQISLHEYLKGMGRPESEYRRFAVYRTQFEKFDKTGNGYLRKEELASGIRASGTEISDRLMDVLFRIMDRRRSGQVEYDEFLYFFFGVELP